MSKAAEWPAEALSEDSYRKFMLHLINFMDATSTFELETLEYATLPKPALQPLLAPDTILRNSYGELMQSWRVIDASLGDVGGIPHHFDDTATGERVHCRFTGWLGVDPDETDKHLWRTTQNPQVSIAIEASFLDELRQKYS